MHDLLYVFLQLWYMPDHKTPKKLRLHIIIGMNNTVSCINDSA